VEKFMDDIWQEKEPKEAAEWIGRKKAASQTVAVPGRNGVFGRMHETKKVRVVLNEIR